MLVSELLSRLIWQNMVIIASIGLYTLTAVLCECRTVKVLRVVEHAHLAHLDLGQRAATVLTAAKHRNSSDGTLRWLTLPFLIVCARYSCSVLILLLLMNYHL
jgi:hypothetical protein